MERTPSLYLAQTATATTAAAADTAAAAAQKQGLSPIPASAPLQAQCAQHTLMPRTPYDAR